MDVEECREGSQLDSDEIRNNTLEEQEKDGVEKSVNSSLEFHITQVGDKIKLMKIRTIISHIRRGS